jgi:2-C-methyl-D-erythritol 2,4-cyclodiphosphate synthase
LDTTVTAYVEGRQLFLGGLELESTLGLLGHSDGDSLCHAICDALLGAAGLRDIGSHFPDNDPKFAGYWRARAVAPLESASRWLSFLISSIDATVIAELPKLSPHIAEMRARIAEALGIDGLQVSIKAKTNEGLDAIGRNEAIAAAGSGADHAVMRAQDLIEKKRDGGELRRKRSPG